MADGGDCAGDGGLHRDAAAFVPRWWRRGRTWLSRFGLRADESHGRSDHLQHSQPDRAQGHDADDGGRYRADGRGPGDSVSLTAGLAMVFASSGNPRQLLVLRKGTDAELTSTVSNEAYQIIRHLPGIATTLDGQPMVSPEGLTVVNLPSVDSPQGMNVTIRGLLPIGLTMRSFTIEQGRPLEPGLRQVIVGEAIARRYPMRGLAGSSVSVEACGR